MTYNPSNIFAKIINKEISSSIVYEDDKILAFKDVNPKSKIHILVIPKGNYIDFADFTKNASAEDVSYFFKKVEEIASDVLNLKHFKLNINTGKDSGQEVFHFHVHILSF